MNKKEINPFRKDLKIVTNRKLTKNTYRHSDRENAKSNNLSSPYDVELNIKIFLTAFKDLMKLDLWQYKLFFYICEQLIRTHDRNMRKYRRNRKNDQTIKAPQLPETVQIINKDVLKKIGKTRNDYLKDAINGLEKLDFIKRLEETKKIYWVNPSKFFSGNRVKKYPDNITYSRTIEDENLFDAVKKEAGTPPPIDFTL